jgi:hypothetical protein
MYEKICNDFTEMSPQTHPPPVENSPDFDQCPTMALVP